MLGKINVAALQRKGRAFELSYLLRNFDLSSAEGRAQERQRRIALSALTSGLAKIISVSTALISVPLTLHYLGVERYGMWMTMSSLVAMLGFADLGIGNGLVTSIAAANGRNDRAAIRSYLSSAYCVLTLMSFVILGVFCAGYSFINWSRVFNVQTELARREAGPALTVLIVCFALGIPFGIVQKVQSGLQRGFVASIWQCGGSVLGLMAVLIAVKVRASLPVLVLCYVGAPLVVGMLNTGALFLFHQRDMLPSSEFITLSAVKSIAATGILYLIFQIAGTIAFSTDSLVIAKFFGASAVAQYAVSEKLFSLIGTTISMILAPLWPAYAEAMARDDRKWVLRTFKLSIVASFGISALLSIAFVSLGHILIATWVGSAVTSSISLFCALGVRKIIEALSGAISFLLNGSGAMVVQVVAATVTAASCLIAKVLVAPYFGVAGVVWASVVPMMVIGMPPIILAAKAILIGNDSDRRLTRAHL